MPLQRWSVRSNEVVQRDDQDDDRDGFLLLTVEEPSAADLDALAAELGLDPAVRDEVADTHLRPQLRAHRGCLAVVVKTPTLDEDSEVELGEVVALVTEHAAAVVGREAGTVVEDLLVQLRHGAHQPAEVLLALVAVVTPDLDEVLVGLDEDVSDVEAHVFSAERSDHTRTIYRLKRELLELRRAVVPMAGVVDRLATEPSCPVPDDLRDDFRGLLEHAVRTSDGVEHLDALIGSVLDAQLAQIGVRQNEDQRKISAWAAIALVPTVVGGIYGMNFEHMPELGWRYGYAAALALVLTACVSLYLGFRRNDWL